MNAQMNIKNEKRKIIILRLRIKKDGIINQKDIKFQRQELESQIIKDMKWKNNITINFNK